MASAECLIPGSMLVGNSNLQNGEKVVVRCNSDYSLFVLLMLFSRFVVLHSNSLELRLNHTVKK